jgi:hypothetical protein
VVVVTGSVVGATVVVVLSDSEHHVKANTAAAKKGRNLIGYQKATEGCKETLQPLIFVYKIGCIEQTDNYRMKRYVMRCR